MSSQPWPRLAAILILALGATLWRVGLCIAWPQTINGTDAAQYLNLADNLIAGNGYSLWASPPYDPDVYRSPGYPLFLATCRLVGLNLVGIAGVQVFLELASCVLVVASLGSWLGSSRARCAALVALLFCPFTAALPCLLLSEAIVAPLLLLFASLLPHWSSLRGVAGIGLVLGTLSLTRGVFLPLVPVAALMVAWPERHLPWNISLRRGIARGAILLAVSSIVLVPYAVWNKERHGVFSPTPLAGFGRAVWGGVMMMPGFSVPPPPDAWRVHEAIWGDGHFRPSPKELRAADHELERLGRAAIAEQPARYAWGVFRHAIHIWFGVRYLFPLSNPGGEWWRALGIVWLLAGVLGWTRMAATTRERWLFVLPILVTTFVLPWLYVNMRYTSVLYGLLAVAAGACMPRPTFQTPERLA